MFDEVRVTICVEERARFRKELVVRVISPPFSTLAELPAGMRVDDGSAASGAPADTAAAPACSKRVRGDGDAGTPRDERKKAR